MSGESPEEYYARVAAVPGVFGEANVRDAPTEGVEVPQEPVYEVEVPAEEPKTEVVEVVTEPKAEELVEELKAEEPVEEVKDEAPKPRGRKPAAKKAE